MTSGGPLHYRLPDQGKPVDEALLLQEASCSESLILIGDFSTQMSTEKQDGKLQVIQESPGMCCG